MCLVQFKEALTKVNAPGDNHAMKAYREDDFMPNASQTQHRLANKMQEQQPGVQRMLTMRTKMHPGECPTTATTPPPKGSWYTYPVNVWRQNGNGESEGWIWTPTQKIGKWCTSPEGYQGVAEKHPHDEDGNWNPQITLWCPNCGREAIQASEWRSATSCNCPISSIPRSFCNVLPHWLDEKSRSVSNIIYKQMAMEDYEFNLTPLHD